MLTGMRPTAGLEVLKSKWGWFLALGAAQIILGMIAVGAPNLTTLFTVKFLGWLLIISGVMSFVHSFCERQWHGFFIDMLTGLFYAIVGFMLVANPLDSAVTLTLVIAMFLIIGGAFRIAEGLFAAFPHRGWVLINGIITLILGIMIWRQWPNSSLWVIGLFVGIELIFYGWSLVMLALAAKSIPSSTPGAA